MTTDENKEDVNISEIIQEETTRPTRNRSG